MNSIIIQTFIFSAKPLIDNDAPRAPIHMHLKLNKLQAEEVHVTRVEKENRMLMEKISYIMRSKVLKINATIIRIANFKFEFSVVVTYWQDFLWTHSIIIVITFKQRFFNFSFINCDRT